MMERAPLKATSATFGPFPAAPGYHSVSEQVLFANNPLSFESFVFF